MEYRVHHQTDLKYANPVSQAQFNLRLKPWGWPGQSVTDCSVVISPEPELRKDLVGPYCVNTSHIVFQTKLSRLSITSAFTVTVEDKPAPGEGPRSAQVTAEAMELRDLSVIAPAPYSFASQIAEVDADVGAWAQEHLLPDAGIVPSVTALMGAIHSEFAYKPGSTTSATPPTEAFAKRTGVCQDFAHVMIMALRSHGIPAAYVSGYLRTIPPPGKERLVGADAMHAWVNVWCGRELGWIGFDPTNNCLARADHILIGMGRDYADVSPIDGTFFGSAPQTMKSAVDVVATEETTPA